MDDLISRQPEQRTLTEDDYAYCTECDHVEMCRWYPMYGCEFKSRPSAQRTGRWIVVSDGYGNGEATACICECSECKDTIWVYKKSDRKWKYCPNCGARMEGVEDGSD